MTLVRAEAMIRRAQPCLLPWSSTSRDVPPRRGTARNIRLAPPPACGRPEAGDVLVVSKVIERWRLRRDELPIQNVN
jgi:hypothetical protein